MYRNHHKHDSETGITHDIDLPGDLLAALKKLLPEGCAADTIDIIFSRSRRGKVIKI